MQGRDWFSDRSLVTTGRKLNGILKQEPTFRKAPDLARGEEVGEAGACRRGELLARGQRMAAKAHVVYGLSEDNSGGSEATYQF